MANSPIPSRIISGRSHSPLSGYSPKINPRAPSTAASWAPTPSYHGSTTTSSLSLRVPFQSSQTFSRSSRGPLSRTRGSFHSNIGGATSSDLNPRIPSWSSQESRASGDPLSRTSGSLHSNVDSAASPDLNPRVFSLSSQTQSHTSGGTLPRTSGGATSSNLNPRVPSLSSQMHSRISRGPLPRISGSSTSNVGSATSSDLNSRVPSRSSQMQSYKTGSPPPRTLSFHSNASSGGTSSNMNARVPSLSSQKQSQSRSIIESTQPTLSRNMHELAYDNDQPSALDPIAESFHRFSGYI